jgi:hypothetical protein
VRWFKTFLVGLFFSAAANAQLPFSVWNTHIDTLAELNAIIGDATLVDGAHFTPNADPGIDHSSYVAGHGDGGNCASGSYPLGVDAAGAVQSCTDVTTEIDSAISTHAAVVDAHIDHADNLTELNTQIGASISDGAHTSDTNANTICTGTDVYLDGEGNCDTISASGEANTSSSSGGGLSVVETKVGVDLPHASFAAADFDLAASVLSIDDATWVSEANLTTHINTTDAHIDHADSLAELNAQISSGLVTGPHTVLPTTEVRSISWNAGALNSDGTQCADPAEVTINSGPILYSIICTDNDASVIHGKTTMPDSWDAGNLTFELEYIQTAANTAALEWDIYVQCRGAGETVNNTWESPVNVIDAVTTGSNAVDQTTSGNVTCASDAGGDTLYWKVEIDAAGTLAAMATMHFTNMKMEYTSTIGD